jgi:hypothetical protein
MKLRNLLAATAALGLMAAATASSAATITWASSTPDDLNVLPAGFSLLTDFDGGGDPNAVFAGNVLSFPASVSNSAPPPFSGGSDLCCNSSSAIYKADDTNYASVQGNGVSTLKLLSGYLTSFSFYMGSPDTYNTVIFGIAGAPDDVFSGAAIWGGVPAGNGDRTKGYRVTYNFNGAKVKTITFKSGSDAFEFDSLAGTSVVPEPTSWALMILGLGGVGAALRSRRKLAFA